MTDQRHPKPIHDAVSLVRSLSGKTPVMPLTGFSVNAIYCSNSRLSRFTGIEFMRALIWKSFFTSWRKGELNRRQYAFCLVLWLIVVVAIPLSTIIFYTTDWVGPDSENGGQAFAMIILWVWVMAPTLPFLFNMSVKRIRNTGLPGWKSLLVFYLFVTVVRYLLSIYPYFIVEIISGPGLTILPFIALIFLPAGCIVGYVQPGSTEIDKRAE